LCCSWSGPSSGETTISKPRRAAAGGFRAGAAISDTAITAQVKAKLLDDRQFSNSNISVITSNGAVYWSGNASTSEVKHVAAVDSTFTGLRVIT
jgi:osmotically-inducible protein OsmY